MAPFCRTNKIMQNESEREVLGDVKVPASQRQGAFHT